jgi:hypothetical protein
LKGVDICRRPSYDVFKLDKGDQVSKGKLIGIIVGVVCIIAIIVVVLVINRTYTLTTDVNPAGAGFVSPSGGQYKSGVQVTLTASPATDYTFGYWSGSASGAASNVTITMDSDKSITAYFEKLPKLTLDDATKVLDLSSQLPQEFMGSYSSEPMELGLLGTGSGSQFYRIGTVVVTPTWYQIQLILWVVDDEVAQNTSVEEVFAELRLTGNHIDVGNNADAVKSGDYGSGIEWLVIKYRNAYVILDSWYSHPQDEYVDMIPLARTIVEHLKGYSY